MRRRKFIVSLILFFLILAGVFLPGPNGLIKVLIKFYRIRKNRAQMLYFKAKADSLEKEIKLWQDPQFTLKVVRRVFYK